MNLRKVVIVNNNAITLHDFYFRRIIDIDLVLSKRNLLYHNYLLDR